ncbi:L-cystine transport system permease protein TcyB [Streptomyces sp. enrichment culture]
MEFFRGTSLYVQLFWLYYALPLVTGSPLFCGVVAFGMNFGAYGSEVVRGALNAVPEACRALSLSPRRTWQAVILPQAVREVLPALGDYAIAMFNARSWWAASR